VCLVVVGAWSSRCQNGKRLFVERRETSNGLSGTLFYLYIKRRREVDVSRSKSVVSVRCGFI
jgi:hypothetical protein